MRVQVWQQVYRCLVRVHCGCRMKALRLMVGRLFKQPDVVAVQGDVQQIGSDRAALLRDIVKQAEIAHAKKKTPVIFTSRVEQVFSDQAARLGFGEQVSALLMEVVKNLPVSIGYLISKGGITSNDVLSTGLALQTSRVVGQILPGCSVVCCPDDHPRFPNMPVVIFPGNVGDENALSKIFQCLPNTE